MTTPPPYDLIAEFERPEALRDAVLAAQEAGYSRLDAFSPFPLREVAQALGARPSAVPWIAAAAGLIGGLVQYGTQYGLNVLDYPLNVGGRPLHSWPAFIPATLIVAILWTGVATLLGMLLMIRLPRLHHPVFGVPGFERASEDRFFLLLEGKDPRFDAEASRAFLSSLGARTVREVPACG